MNTLTFTVSELKSLLFGLGKIIPRHGLPVLQHIRFIRDEAGIVSLHAMDLDAYARYQFPQPVPGPILDLLVPYEPLNRILRSTKGRVQVIPDGALVIVRTFVGDSPIDQRLDTKPVEEWPPLPPITALPVPITAEAITAIQEAMDFASNDETRIAINCVCLDVSNKDAHYVVGTNGRALYSANSFKFALKEPVSIPTHKFWMWNGLPVEDCTLAVQPAGDKDHVGWLKFQFTDWLFITKQQFGNYPNWQQVVPRDFNVTLDFNEDAVSAVLLAVPQLPGADERDKPVTLRIINNQVSVENEGTRIPIAGVSINGKPMVIRLNRDYLLLCFKTGLTSIHLIDDLSPLVFTKDGKRAVVMPLRGGEPPAPVPHTPASQPEPETTPVTQPASTKEPKPMPAETKTNASSAATVVEDVLNRVASLKENLKDFLRDLQEIHTLLKQVEREKKATDKEIETVRAKLREIQAVKI